MWCGRGTQLTDIGNKNVREEELNPILGHSMARLNNWQKTYQIGVTGYIIVLRKMCSERIDWIELRTQINEFGNFICVYNDEIEFIMMKRTLKTILENSVKKTMHK